MKKVLTIFSMILTISIFSANDTHAQPDTHMVEAGDSLYKLSQIYNVSIESLQRVNHLDSTLIYIGEILKVPAAISADEKELLARLVRAEAEGEPYAGKVAVALVVLNRVDHHEFPNTIEQVIEEVTPSGHYAFSPVLDGSINKPANEESIKAVEEAIGLRGQGDGSLFFYNPAIATNHWNATRTETARIGNHVFSK